MTKHTHLNTCMHSTHSNTSTHTTLASHNTQIIVIHTHTLFHMSGSTHRCGSMSCPLVTHWWGKLPTRGKMHGTPLGMSPSAPHLFITSGTLEGPLVSEIFCVLVVLGHFPTVGRVATSGGGNSCIVGCHHWVFEFGVALSAMLMRECLGSFSLEFPMGVCCFHRPWPRCS